MAKPVELSGLEWKAFLADSGIWTAEAWADEETILFNGKETENWERCSDTTLVKVVTGVIEYALGKGKDNKCLVSTLREWLHARQRVVILVETTHEFEDATRFALKTAGLKVLN